MLHLKREMNYEFVSSQGNENILWNVYGPFKKVSGNTL